MTYSIPLPAWCTRLISNAERIARLPAVPTPTKLLKAQTGLTAHALGVHLTMAGWHRELVWSRSADDKRVLTAWWCPPGAYAPRLPRGRPRIDMTLAEAINLLN